MIEIFIKRISDNGKQTQGELQIIEQHEPADLILFECKTLELPWLNNQQGKSCIPADRYLCKKVGPSEHINYPHIAIQDVPNRSGCCIHIANFVKQLLGCIAVGKDFVDIDKDGLQDVTSSKDTLKALMALLPDEFYLTII